MGKLNLQLFASIVDYLNKRGEDSSFSNRQKLANQYGLKDYTGTAEQNNELIGLIEGNTKTKNKNSGTTNNTTNNTTSTGIADSTTKGNTNSLSSSNFKLNGVDQSLVDRMFTDFKTSEEYNQANSILAQLREQALSGKTSYTDQMNDLMNQVLNRDSFEYDMDKDPMFQQYLATMMNTGQTAMQDTIGQASALTGGYGSSYATSSGNQAYNQYIQDAYNNLPEFYQMALNTYQMEGEDLLNKYGIVSDADSREYGRTIDSYSIQNDYANNLWNREYQTWSDSVSNAMNLAGMQNSDWWNKTNFDESVRQYNENMAFQKEQFAWQKANAGRSSGGSGSSKKISGGSPILKQPDQEMYDEAMKRYATGGMKALNAYLNSLPGDLNKTLLAEHVGAYGEELPKNWNTLGFKLNLK